MGRMENKPIKAIFLKLFLFAFLSFSLLFATGKRTRIETRNWEKSTEEARVKCGIRVSSRQGGKTCNVGKQATSTLLEFIDLTIKQCWTRFFFSSKYSRRIYCTSYTIHRDPQYKRDWERAQNREFPFLVFFFIFIFHISYQIFVSSSSSIMDIFSYFLLRMVELRLVIALPSTFLSTFRLGRKQKWNNFHNFALILPSTNEHFHSSSTLTFIKFQISQFCFLKKNFFSIPPRATSSKLLEISCYAIEACRSVDVRGEGSAGEKRRRGLRNLRAFVCGWKLKKKTFSH